MDMSIVAMLTSDHAFAVPFCGVSDAEQMLLFFAFEWELVIMEVNQVKYCPTNAARQ